MSLRRLAFPALLGLALLAPLLPAAAQSGNPGAAYLKKMAAQPGAHRLADGLVYKVLKSGPPDGPHPIPGDKVRVLYSGTLPDGTVFDSTDKHGGQPATLNLNNLIPGWVEALELMRPGDTWMLYIPADLAYGEDGQGPIPGDTPLTFRISLLGIEHDPNTTYSVIK